MKWPAFSLKNSFGKNNEYLIGNKPIYHNQKTFRFTVTYYYLCKARSYIEKWKRKGINRKLKI